LSSCSQRKKEGRVKMNALKKSLLAVVLSRCQIVCKRN
jgi:hypothetical protein